MRLFTGIGGNILGGLTLFFYWEGFLLPGFWGGAFLIKVGDTFYDNSVVSGYLLC